MQNILITGGSGLIGTALTSFLQEKGFNVAWLSRGQQQKSSVRVFRWDVAARKIDADAITWADVIIHLAGEGIADKRWTNTRKKQIIDSRTNSTSLLIEAMQRHPHHIKTIIAASAIGFYGETADIPITEQHEAGDGFLSESVGLWEKATKQFNDVGVRLVTLRIGVVLSLKGGALKEILQTRAIRVIPQMGNGKQHYSWIHIDDLLHIFHYVLANPVTGIYNAVSPSPVSQKVLLKAFAMAQDKWYLIMPVPAFVLRLVLGEMSDVVLLNQNVSAAKILNEQFVFGFPKIIPALTDIIEHNK